MLHMSAPVLEGGIIVDINTIVPERIFDFAGGYDSRRLSRLISGIFETLRDYPHVRSRMTTV